MPFMSKQKGRMSHLLKQKTKIGRAKAERKTYDAYDFMKRQRTSLESSKEALVRMPKGERILLKSLEYHCPACRPMNAWKPSRR